MSLNDEKLGSSSPKLDDVHDVGIQPTLGAVEFKDTRRHLKPRHIQMIAISGAIGTGLYIGTGSALVKAGPVGLVLGFAVYGILVLSTFNAMGEMVAYLPIDGTYIQYAARFVDHSFGFSMGWLEYWNYAVTVAQEAVAVAGMINYWNDTTSNAVWCVIFLLSIVAFNVFGVRYFGEGEFWFSIFKVLLILGLMFFTVITMAGGNPQRDAFGFRHWGTPAPFNEYISSGSLGKFLGFFSTFVTAAYSYGGPDYLAMTSGEAMYPRRVMPNVFRRVIWRLLFFYVGGTLCVSILIPSDDSALGEARKGAGSSPFVLAAVRMGIPALPSIINAVIMTSAWSCGVANSFTASRVLYTLALRGSAPAIFKRTHNGVPAFAIGLTVVVGCLSFLTVSNGAAVAFTYITNITGALWIVSLGLQHIIYIRFRKGLAAQGIDRSTIPFYRRHQLIYSWICLIFYIILYLTNGFPVFTAGRWTVRDFLFAYMVVPIFIVLYVGHKFYSVFRGKQPWGLIPAETMDFVSDKAEVDQDELTYPAYGTSRKDKFFHWLWGA